MHIFSALILFQATCTKTRTDSDVSVMFVKFIVGNVSIMCKTILKPGASFIFFKEEKYKNAINIQMQTAATLILSVKCLKVTRENCARSKMSTCSVYFKLGSD